MIKQKVEQYNLDLGKELEAEFEVGCSVELLL